MTVKRFKVGDKVKVIDSLSMDCYDYDMSINYEMEKCRGRTLPISEVGRHFYRLKEVGWAWTDEMFEKELPKPKTLKIINGVEYC